MPLCKLLVVMLLIGLFGFAVDLKADTAVGQRGLFRRQASKHHETWDKLFTIVGKETLEILRELPDEGLSLRASWEIIVNREAGGLNEDKANRFLTTLRTKLDIERVPNVWQSSLFASAKNSANAELPIDFETPLGLLASTGQIRHSKSTTIALVDGQYVVTERTTGRTVAIEERLLRGFDFSAAFVDATCFVVTYKCNRPGTATLRCFEGDECRWARPVWAFPFGDAGKTHQIIDVITANDQVYVFGANVAFLFVEAFDFTGNEAFRFTSHELGW